MLLNILGHCWRKGVFEQHSRSRRFGFLLLAGDTDCHRFGQQLDESCLERSYPAATIQAVRIADSINCGNQLAVFIQHGSNDDRLCKTLRLAGIGRLIPGRGLTGKLVQGSLVEANT